MANGKLPNLLRRLQKKLPADPGCPACRHRQGRIVMVEAERRPDASVVLRDQEPAACNQWGIVPEIVVMVYRSVAERGD